MSLYRGEAMTEVQKLDAAADLIAGIIELFEAFSREFAENRDIIIASGHTDTSVDAEIAEFRKLVSVALDSGLVGETVLPDLYFGAQDLIAKIEELTLVAVLDIDGELREAAC